MLNRLYVFGLGKYLFAFIGSDEIIDGYSRLCN